MSAFEVCAICGRRQKTFSRRAGRQHRQVCHPHTDYREAFPDSRDRQRSARAGEPCCILHGIIPADKPTGWGHSSGKAEERYEYYTWREQAKSQ